MSTFREAAAHFLDDLLILGHDSSLADELDKAAAERNCRLFERANRLLEQNAEPRGKAVYAGNDGSGGNGWNHLPVRE